MLDQSSGHKLSGLSRPTTAARNLSDKLKGATASKKVLIPEQQKTRPQII